jgi:hypothetical protein
VTKLEQNDKNIFAKWFHAVTKLTTFSVKEKNFSLKIFQYKSFDEIPQIRPFEKIKNPSKKKTSKGILDSDSK